LVSVGLLLTKITKTPAGEVKLSTLPQKEIAASPTPGEIITPSPQPSALSLAITSPEDESIVREQKITLKGNTEKNAIVSVVFEEGEMLGEADSEGNFSFEIPLIKGANEITLTASNLEGKETSKTITVVYTTAEVE